MDTAARTPALARAHIRLSALGQTSTLVWLGAIVAASFAARSLLAWLHATPAYYQDEYLYAELGRSLVETGQPLIRGAGADFPALLQPLLTAPAWLVGDLTVAYHLVQTIGAFAMSLAAVPVFLLARHLDLGRAVALGLAALTLSVPDLVYASWVVSEPIAYPLALAAVAAGSVALARVTRGAQLAFVAFAGLACFARVQLVVIPLCFLAAAVVAGMRERRLRAAVREQALPLALLGAPALVLGLVTQERVLGIYRGVLSLELDPLALLRWSGNDAMILLYSSGWILVPGAILGLALALWRPRSRPELTFAAFATFLLVGLVLESAAIASNVDRIQERYVFYAVPLIALAFGLYAQRGWPFALPHGLLAGGLIALSAAVPLSGFIAGAGGGDSPFLIGATRVAETFGGLADGSLAIAVAVGALSLVAAALPLLSRFGTPIALGLAVVACGTTSVATIAFDQRNAGRVREAFLPFETSWIDRAGLGDVTLLSAPGARRSDALSQLFWNRSVTRVALLPGARPFDSFAIRPLELARDGSVLVDGEPLVGPVLVDEFGAVARLRDARRVAAAPNYSLWRPEGRARLALYLTGRFNDGWLAPAGIVTIWPKPGETTVSGRLVLTLRAPKEKGATTVRVRPTSGEAVSARVAPGEPARLVVPVCSQGLWEARFSADLRGFVDGRLVSARAGFPVFTPDPSACDTPSSSLARRLPIEKA